MTATSAASPTVAPMRLLWYGNHGAPHARFGMLDLLDVGEDLERIAREFPVQLIVVSNNREKYEKHIKPLNIPSRYEEWSSERVDRWLSKASVVLIPNSLDEFSICKSANRAVHALMRRVPVVATPTPALACLSDAIETGGFYDGLRKYLSDPTAGRRDTARAIELIDRNFSAPVLGAAWHQALVPVIAAARTRRGQRTAELVIALNLVQDLDLALPVIEAARARRVAVEVWCSMALLKKSPRVARRLRSIGTAPVGVLEDAVGVVDFPPGIRALLTVTETSLGPHRFTRALTERAKREGIRTGTMQHGLENVGLTYSDAVHAVGAVSIAADRIYLWSGLESLDASVDDELRARCVPAGCTKPAQEQEDDPPLPLPEAGKVVGVFENLHWHRYSDDYRAFFLDSLTEAAAAFPAVTFLVKPHHAGMWLTSRFTGERPRLPNIVVADPTDPSWEPYTSGGLLGRMSAVVTTPSTVALDAARRGLPVAVVARGLEVGRYHPLTLLRERSDWHSFLASSLDAANALDHRRVADEFVEKSIRPGNAATFIVDDLVRAKR
jgi:hypothetical protein